MVVLGIVLDTEAYECMTSVVEEDNIIGDALHPKHIHPKKG